MRDPNNPDWDICPGGVSITEPSLQARLDATRRYIDLLRDPLVSPRDVPTIAQLRKNEPEEHHPNKETADALN
jgi:hypothetical protein